METFGLLGRKLGHSWSPAIHALLGDYPYRLFEKEPAELEDFLRGGSWQGLNVTIPYKKAVLPYCAELSPLARKLGSVNTLIRRPDGSIRGDNTDAYGFLLMLQSLGLSCAGKKALVLGSGGASVTVQEVLREQGAYVTVISRQGEHHYGNLHLHTDASILVNGTPVGMYPGNGQAPLSLAGFPRLEAVLDLIYNPARTALLLEAARRGIPSMSGLTMLVGQAARASELFTGTVISQERQDAVLRTMGASMENLILIGMPGCGKTTVGMALAHRLNRPFVDADREIEAAAGKTIPEIITQEGEDGFRELEAQVLSRLGAASGHVIATGGGCVTRPENYESLHQNGRIIWLRRPLEALSTEGRPLSQRYGAAALYETRRDLYQAFSNLIVDNTGTVFETVTAIVEASQP